MTETSRYMAVLAKVMKNKSLPENGMDKERYNKLYFLLHSDLKTQLQKSMYPYTPDIIQKAEDMMETMESLYICPEIVGTKCILVSSYITTHIFDVCHSLFVNQEFVSVFRKMYTQIPFIIVDSEDDNSVETLNYANVRIKLSVNELKFLMVESNKRKIALNKIVQFIIIKTKLREKNLCIFADNIYGNADKVFWRTISKRIAYIDTEGMKTIKKRHLNDYSALVMSDEVLSNTINNPAIRTYCTLTFGEMSAYIKNEAKSVLYGFWDEFISIETQIMDYYEKQILQSKENLQEVTGDIVRLGDRQDGRLHSIRSYEQTRERKLKDEAKSIKNALKNIEEFVVEICNELGESVITGKKILRYTMDDIFEAFFRCNNFSSDLGKKIISRLYSYEYNNYELLSAYVQWMSGKEVKYQAIEIGQFEWEKAKILIRILDVDKVSESYLKLYIDVLGNRCSTGKELYVKSLISRGEQKIELLQASLEKGYQPAGQALIEMYKNGYRTVNLLSLANALVPEACMILADQKLRSYQNKKKYVDLSSSEFTYLKIAATKQYLPAIGKIVDVVFNSRFSSGFQIPKDEMDNSKYKEMIENGYLVCQLCQFLIEKMYYVDYYSEIYGIVLFCLNENLSGAMNLLMKANSALAYYCKGNMYEFGGGVTIDLDQAIENYEKSINKGFTGRVEKRLSACYGKKERYSEETDSDDYYQSNRSYSSQSRRTSSTTVDDGCFTPETKILMADGSYCKVKNIKRDDWVLVFDHYNGRIKKEKIIANVHDISEKKVIHVISMIFENGTKLDIVKSHVLFDITDNQYVYIDNQNVRNYLGHAFAFLENQKIKPQILIDYAIELKKTTYYAPISRIHINVFAENFLTMPPTKLTVNMFHISKDMLYDLSILDKSGITSYDEIAGFVSMEEYEELPCKYLSAVLLVNNCTIKDVEDALMRYREQGKYLEIEERKS